MSVETQIARIRGNIASAYAQAAQKGAQLPAVQNSENLPGTIMGIPAGGLPDDVYTITVESSDQAGGSASGGGVLSRGMAVTVTVEAVAVDGYHFVNWQENGQTVSESESYTFTVTGDRTLMAVFEESKYVSGADWWETTLPSSARWRSVTYGAGKFVAVADLNKTFVYSTDGITWTTTATIFSANWYGVTYGGGKFVAVAFNSNKVAYSADGITWAEVTLPVSAEWNGVTYGGGKFVAVAGGSNTAAYSTDGITWKAATLPVSTNWFGVTYGDGKFVAVSSNNKNNKTAYSADGITWTEATLSYGFWTGITYGDGKFVAVANINPKIACSTNGITWKTATLPAALQEVYNWYGVTYGAGKFVAVAYSSNKAVYSSGKGPGV